MLRLILYTTDHCTLCEQALDLLLSMPQLVGHELLVMEVTSDDALLQRYGERIPVLVCDGMELDAPITAEGVARLMAR